MHPDEKALYEIFHASKDRARSVLFDENREKIATKEHGKTRSELITSVVTHCFQESDDGRKNESTLNNRYQAAMNLYLHERLCSNDKWIVLTLNKKIKAADEKIRTDPRVRLLALLLCLANSSASCRALGMTITPSLHTMVAAMNYLDLRGKVLKTYDEVTAKVNSYIESMQCSAVDPPGTPSR